MSFSNYIKETRSELKHVNWLSRRQTVFYTLLVVGVSAFTAFILGAFDIVFSELLKTLIAYVR